MYSKFFKDKKILITGHTGFKGSWLSLWLYILGAKVTGVSSSVLTQPSIFKILKLKNKIEDKRIDIRDYKRFKKIFIKLEPDYVFHLAAEAIVKRSYENPRKTWETNTMGTVNLLEVLKNYNKKVVVVAITSDKVYKNKETKMAYKENDELGGVDPYSSSKASADLAIQSYTNSYLNFKKNIKIGIARAGNVIGGGDWSQGRLIPDCIRSWSNKKKVLIRSPNSTRPWQFVLDVIRGYMLLAINLKKNNNYKNKIFNFGPNEKNKKVIHLLKIAKKNWAKANWNVKINKNLKESNLLQLNSNKAKRYLKWNSKINLNKAINFTIDWYKNYYNKKTNMFLFSVRQIKKFQDLAKTI